MRDCIDPEDLRAAAEFSALLLVLLVLPDERLDVLFGVNPRQVWLVVVFVAGLSFLGYLLSKVVDPGTAIGVTGALGGAVSPGMTITSLTEQYRRHPEFDLAYTVAAAIASTMLFLRNFIVVAIVSPALAKSLVVPFVAMAGVGFLVTGGLWFRTRNREPPTSELNTPFRIRSALAIGGLVAVILALVNSVDLSLSASTTRIGIVVATVVQLSVYVAVTSIAGAKQIARVIVVVLLGSASVGIALVVL
ncbi:hypothetical protein C461_04212 [Halorubrum aidingense JCM 13560]|uniref:DUF4010 domain-containing protein n=1 Tax=Halorubrum aidingense JCM 13560 TaxID=1230454 RepID=M0PFX2_9EURY|nr:DUF4010 domain-containing protein [Halorubrum aidingense]EMA68803.1 hypothetical protein C461_04212 [Halorubrum aidingense JCM 13560]